MSYSLHFVVILLIAFHFGLSSVSGTEDVYIACCQNDTIQLFKNITFKNSGPVNLYLNGIRQTLIVTWESTQNPSFLSGYKATMFQDEYGTLWIRNIQLSHEGKYFLSYKTNNLNVKSEVQVDVMVAPTKQCKPKIRKEGSFLIATLEKNECGRPPASVDWRNQSGISIIERILVKLPSENETGTYSACAETPALKCVETLKLSDYCTTFTIEREVSRQRSEVAIVKDKDIVLPVSSEISDTKIFIIVIGLIILIIILLVAIILIRRRKKRLNATMTGPKRNDEEIVPLTIDEPNAMSKNPKDSEVEMRMSPSAQFASTLNSCRGVEDTTVEATIEHQVSTVSATANEIQELRLTVLCKICNINKMSMHYLLCEHIAKLYNVSSYLPICVNCIIDLPQCARCRRFNRNKSNDEAFWTNMLTIQNV